MAMVFPRSAGCHAGGLPLYWRNQQTVFALRNGPEGARINRLPPGLKMGDVVNLRRARKTVVRQQKADAAAGKRIFHGRSKAERALQKARRDLSDQDLDNHRLGSGEANEVSGRQKV